MLGADDTSLGSVRIMPRIPPGWTGLEARNWPIRTRRQVVRADIVFEKKGKGGALSVQVAPGEQIETLRVRMPSANGYTWRERNQMSSAQFATL